MKVTIDIEVNDEVLLKLLEKSKDENFDVSEIAQAIQTNIGLKLKADIAKVVIDLCKSQNIPLGDLLTSNG